jgi:hypothetical protein
MFHINRRDVLPVNRKIVDNYLGGSAFKDLELLLRSVNPYLSSSDTGVSGEILSYIQEEESKIESNLVSIMYNIDAPSTIGLVAGTQRTEQASFCTKYHLVSADFL